MTPLWRRYARFFGADPAADVKDELRFHLSAKVDDLIAQGWRPEDARTEAIRQFGDLESVQELGVRMSEEKDRQQQRRDYWGGFAQDLRYTFRTLLRDRAYALIVILILGLGIAANTAVFSVVNTVLLRPLPFADSERLVWISSDRKMTPEERAGAGLSALTYTVAAFEEYQRHNKSFEKVTAFNPFYGSSDYTLTGRGEPQPAAGVIVACDFFQTLGVQPLYGRLLRPEDCHKGAQPAVLLSHHFWRNHFSSDPAIVGQAVTFNKQAFLVAGIMPASFDFGAVFAPGLKMDIFTPAVLDQMREWGNTLSLVGRLKPGVPISAAQAEADILFPQFRAAHKEWWQDYASTMTGLQEFVVGKLRRSLMVLWAAVGLILLIVCVNLSNLVLARATARSKEFALRSALGAGRERLFRQLMTESLVLSSAGAMLGLALAYSLVIYLSRQGALALPLLNSMTVDRTALGWTLLITMTAAIIFALVPAVKFAGGNLQDTLKDSGAGVSTGRHHERMRAVMVISEVALACMLLVGAGLLLRSFLKVLDVDLGFKPSRAAVIRVDYDAGEKGEKRGPVLEQMLRAVTALPGVEQAGIADQLPLGRNRNWGFAAKGVVYPKDTKQIALVRITTPGYLGAMGMQLRQGRDFSWADTQNSERVVIINQAAARIFWPNRDPLGQIALAGGRESKVIGIIADVRDHSLELAPGPEMYLHVTQSYPDGAELVVRTAMAPETLAPAIMRTLRSLNPAQPAAELRPLRELVDRSVSPRRFIVMLVSGFALLGLVLASLGIYGVISYSVTRQTQEIGIRMALGATAPQVQYGVMSQALRLALAGVAIGTAGSVIAARWIASLLFGTEPTDPVTFAGIVLILSTVALAAGYLPARRASRIDPMVALRTA
jgi:predicted permease